MMMIEIILSEMKTKNLFINSFAYVRFTHGRSIRFVSTVQFYFDM